MGIAMIESKIAEIAMTVINSIKVNAWRLRLIDFETRTLATVANEFECFISISPSFLFKFITELQLLVANKSPLSPHSIPQDTY